MCWFDQTGAPISAVEPIAGYINPDTVIKVISDVDFHEDFPSARPGDIFVDFARNKPEVSSAMLGRTISPKSGDRWVRWIDTDSGEKIGFMFVERPVPDPDTRFESLAQDSLLAGIPTGLQSEINPASLIPSPTSGCATNKCLAVIPSADIFYLGPEPTNTACLPAITSPPPSPARPQVPMDPSSVYVVYHPPQVFDMCRNWIFGLDGPPLTMSYQSQWLSTLEYRSNAPPATKSLDFADLPCPPSDVAKMYDTGTPYFPILISLLRARNSTLDVLPNGTVSVNDEACDVAAVRDPPVYAHWVPRISGKKDGGDRII